MKIPLKNKDEQKAIIEGGKHLSYIKKSLERAVSVGVSSWDLEVLANRLIDESGGRASFKLVPGYSWATCVNVNEGIVHGIPKEDVIFAKGDVVSVDVGLFYKGFNTDTSTTVGLDVNVQTKKFLESGKVALSKAISEAKSGNRIYDISKAIEKTIMGDGYKPVIKLVGHGVGRDLHEDPQIPGVVIGRYEDSPLIVPGMVLAIEVIYALGDSEIKYNKDRWTIETADGKISALYEETVVVT